jgi:tetratricopeptide (TPR) repeat protein
MDQLRLFPDVAPQADRPADNAAAVADKPSDIQNGDPAQEGLFDARLARTRAVRQAIASGQLDEALDLLASLKAGSDFDVAAIGERVSKIRAELARASRAPQSESAMALAALARTMTSDNMPWSALARTLLVLAARAVEREPDARAGRLYMESGDLDRARSVLVSTLSCSRTASLLFALGDAETKRADRASARRWYRDALLLDPFDAAFQEVLDEDVRALADLAEREVEQESEPRAWAAAVGMVVGVLVPPGDSPLEASEPEGMTSSAREALARMRQFVRALAFTAASHTAVDRNAVIEARRTMKHASPALFALYMARRTGS